MIKHSILSLLFVALLGISCSSDKDNTMGTTSIEGTWDVAELKVDDSNNAVNSTSIPCPSTFEEEEAAWSLEGDQLTITDATGLAETVTIQLSNSNLIVAGEDIEGETLTGTEIIFKKR